MKVTRLQGRRRKGKGLISRQNGGGAAYSGAAFCAACYFALQKVESVNLWTRGQTCPHFHISSTQRKQWTTESYNEARLYAVLRTAWSSYRDEDSLQQGVFLLKQQHKLQLRQNRHWWRVRPYSLRTPAVISNAVLPLSEITSLIETIILWIYSNKRKMICFVVFKSCIVLHLQTFISLWCLPSGNMLLSVLI